MKILVINCSPVRNGATAEIVRIISSQLSAGAEVRAVCIDDYSISFCLGCRSCHSTGRCVQRDDAEKLMEQFDWADSIVAVSPSYWADVPGQFKSFIDRCTPWSNTHEPHASLRSGKKGYCAVLRTGPNMKECQRLIGTIAHFFGHLDVQFCGGLGMCSVENRSDVASHTAELADLCAAIASGEGYAQE